MYEWKGGEGLGTLKTEKGERDAESRDIFEIIELVGERYKRGGVNGMIKRV